MQLLQEKKILYKIVHCNQRFCVGKAFIPYRRTSYLVSLKPENISFYITKKICLRAQFDDLNVDLTFLEKGSQILYT